MARRPGAQLGATSFLDAARHWDVARVTEALRMHSELATATDARGRTALHLCAGATSARTRRSPSAAIATARALLKAGADIDAVHEIADDGEAFPARPLWHAIARGRNRALARFLLKQGANPDYCLWAVVWDDDVVMAKLLQAHGADLDLRFHGETPLLYATRLRRSRMVKWLLRHGADANLADHDGRTPLAFAIARRHTLAEVDDLLAHGAEPTLAAVVAGSSPLLRVGSNRGAALLARLREAAMLRRGA